MIKEMDLGGTYQVTLEDGSRYQAQLPGSLDENRIGCRDMDSAPWHPDVELVNDTARNPVLNAEGIITGRLTRKYTYEGKVAFERSFSFREKQQNPQNRIILFIERSRKLKAVLNETELIPYEAGTLSTPWRYDVTAVIREENTLCLISDNSYQGWPAAAIKYSSAATDESQTNWNGLLGKICLQIHQADYIVRAGVYTEVNGEENCAVVKLLAEVSCAKEETLVLESQAFEEAQSRTLSLKAGKNEIILQGIPLRKDCRKWDEYEGNLYELNITGKDMEPVSCRFGIRSFGEKQSAFLKCNGRRIFLRCETNVGLFPETGHTPMSRKEWKEILDLYKRYGVNCVRFHSWCPPEELFCAADETGMFVQAELSNWDPHTAFESEESAVYYETELLAVLREYAAHPSFVMLTLGNELHCSETGRRRMTELLELARRQVPSCLVSIASNPFYGEKGADPDSDFFTASGYYGEIMRGTSAGMEGHLNHGGNGTAHRYDMLMQKIRKDFRKPVFAFEAGQYEILPDFGEISEFQGAAAPANLQLFEEQAIKRGLRENWEKRVEASGELALLAYREEVEAVMRTSEMSGISLLGLQDFTGQGTALIGMLNSHLRPKPFAFAEPERFQSFFREALPLAEMKKRTFCTDEKLEVHVLLANYGKEDISGQVKIRLTQGKEIFIECSGRDVIAEKGSLTDGGDYGLTLEKLKAPARYELMLDIGTLHNQYAVWIYPAETAKKQLFLKDSSQNRDPANHTVAITGKKEEALRCLKLGKKVLYSPEAEEKNFPGSAKTCFTTDFWSVGTFAFQEGYMGILVDPDAPVFREFPTAFHADWQWYHLTTDARAMLISEKEKPLIEVIDCYARMRHLAFAAEYVSGKGTILISSMGLLEKQQYPEARAMLRSLVHYMESEQFHPTQELELCKI